MKQMKLEGLEKVEIDTIWSKLPNSYHDLKPAIYKNGKDYFCLLGPHPVEGIFGCGDTAEEAIWEWDHHLNELLLDEKNKSEAVEYVRKILRPANPRRENNYKGEF
jgi:hypothetical protein